MASDERDRLRGGRDATSRTRLRVVLDVADQDRAKSFWTTVMGFVLGEARAPDGFDDLDAEASYAEREAIVRGCASMARFALEQVNRG